MFTLSEKAVHANLGDAEMKAKMYYESCLDKNDTIQKKGAKPLLDLLEQLGGWNVSQASGHWAVESFDFQGLLHKIHMYGITNFFDMWVGEDEKQSSRNIMQVRI